MRRGRRRTAGRHAPHRSPHRRCRSSCRRNRRTASRRPHAAAASSATNDLPRPDRVRRTSCGRNRPDVPRDIPPRPVAASHPCGATRGGSRASPAATANPWPWSSGPDRGASPVRRRQDRPAAANRRRLRAPGAGTLQRRSGQSRDWRQSGAWTGRRPTAAAPRGSCAWVISVGPSPLLSKKERSPADSRITQRRSSRPSTALLPWSPSTGTGGRHPPETVVAFNRKPRSPWPGARKVKVASEPEALLKVLGNPTYHFKRIGLEAGPLSQWLFSALAGAELPMICVETRHMQAVLKAQINKTDRNDARGIAQMIRVGLYRPVHVKTLRSQKLRMLLTHRKLLQSKAIAIENDLRGTLRNFGLKVGMVGKVRFEARIQELVENTPDLAVLVEPLLIVRRVLREQIVILHRRLLAIVREDEVCRRLMTTPGVGPVVALTYRATVDVPARC